MYRFSTILVCIENTVYHSLWESQALQHLVPHCVASTQPVTPGDILKGREAVFCLKKSSRVLIISRKLTEMVMLNVKTSRPTTLNIDRRAFQLNQLTSIIFVCNALFIFCGINI